VVGSQTLRRCRTAPVAYCGRLSVPLDEFDPSLTAATLSIAYVWYPATDPSVPATGTVLPVEGGPGYPSIGSVRGGFATMYGPLLRHWNLLALDQRGTGGSGALDCPALRRFAGQPSGAAYARDAGACARALDRRWRTASGAWLEASDLFTTAQAAADMARVVAALGTGPVALYGDSYGSWYAQVFASRYPDLVRSVVPDSTYSVTALDPWYRSTVADMPADVDAVCTRSPACAAAETEPVWTRVGELAAALRRRPVSGTVPDASGVEAPVTMGVVGLVDLLNDAAGDPVVYAELDAAARADLLDADPAPLLRLYAQRLAFDENYVGVPASAYSPEMYLAVSCLDYRQLFDVGVAPAVRRTQLAGAEAALPAGTFAPFTTAEWLAQDQNTEAYTACLDWPSPTLAVPPVAQPPPLLPASVPVLVLGGELDTWTPPTDVPGLLPGIGGHSRFVEVADATHVVGEGDTTCASQLVRAFVAEPGSLDTLDTACADANPPVTAVGSYPDGPSGEIPLTPAAGNAAAIPSLQVAAAALQTVGDALRRQAATGLAADTGLRGGTVSAVAGTLTLRGDVLVPGVAVSGTVRAGAVRGEVQGVVTVTAPGQASMTLTVRWPTTGRGDAAVAGTVGSAGGPVPLDGTAPVP
jgi:pimeloyl-ACP methyl ester carboxylesterase